MRSRSPDLPGAIPRQRAHPCGEWSRFAYLSHWSFSISGLDRNLSLRNILHVPNISKHLLSAHRLMCDNNVFVELHPNFFFVKDRATWRVLLHGRSEHGLYPIPLHRPSSSPARHALSSAKVSSSRWHQRLGHPSPTVARSIIKSNKLESSVQSESLVCDACQRAKSYQLPYNHSTRVFCSL
jgi:hypothetical protein